MIVITARPAPHSTFQPRSLLTAQHYTLSHPDVRGGGRVSRAMADPDPSYLPPPASPDSPGPGQDRER